jgi:flagellar motor switch/type III secretory pathway protein FliN
VLTRAGRLAPFSLEGLPRVPRAAVRNTRAVARALAPLPRELVVSLERLGTIALRSSWVSFVVPSESSGVSFTLEVRGDRGRLTVEPSLAVRLVAGLLGGPSVAVRTLGRAERGTLAAVIAAFLHAAGARGAVRVSLEDTGPIDATDALAIELLVAGADFSGSARLDLPGRLLSSLGSGQLSVDPRLLSPLVTVELGRTTIDGAAFAAAEAGDAVVFEGSSPALADAAWPVQIRLGASWCPGELHPDGTLRRHGPLARNESETTMSSDDANITAPVPALSLSDEASRALASAPVEIVAEIGRLTVRGDELAGLIDGGVLALGPRRPAQVVLRVGGRVWANGELVAVDDELAVRITALVR